MSLLSLPRVNFSGMTGWNPDTTNNYWQFYKANESEPNFEETDTNPATYKHYIIENLVDFGNWNLYGDHATVFQGSQIDGVIEAAGPVTGDEWLGRSVTIDGFVSQNGEKKLPARLVDVAPYGSTSSQIFFDSFHLGDAEVGVVGKRLERFSDRGFYFGRNLNFDNQVMIAGGMGVTWQSSFAKDELTWTGLELSPALASLKEQVEAPGSLGLVVCFASYRTQYFTDCSFNGNPITTFDELRDAYLAGFTGPNPAYSVLTGSAGVWLDGEPVTGPSNRVLLPGAGLALQQAVQPTADASASRKAPLGSKTLSTEETTAVDGTTSKESEQTYPLGPAEARVVILDAVAGTGHVALNFVNTVPEINQDLVKADFGTLTLQVRDSQDVVTPIGALNYADYDAAAYQAGAGIITVPFESTAVVTALSTGVLELAGGDAQVALQEVPLVVVSDAESMYLSENQTKTVELSLFERGQAAQGDGWQISIAQYEGQNNGSARLIVNAADRVARLLNTSGEELPLQSDGTVVLDVEDGKAAFQVTPVRAGNFMLAYYPHAEGVSVQVPVGLDTSQSFSNFRNLPFDSDLRTFEPGETIPWPYIYENVLMVYDLVYPVMSLIIDLHSQEAVDGASQKIEARTGMKIDGHGPQNIFSTSAFMPITRELSDAKRQLLWDYLAQVEAAQKSAG